MASLKLVRSPISGLLVLRKSRTHIVVVVFESKGLYFFSYQINSLLLIKPLSTPNSASPSMNTFNARGLVT